MLVFKSENASQAWRQALATLVENGDAPGNKTYFRDELCLFEISQPLPIRPDPLFPMPAPELDLINRFIVTGERESEVTHEWTRLYHHRMFDPPNSQVEYMIERLSLVEPAFDTQMSLWDKNVDQNQIVSPCTLVIWARRRGNTLETHVHAHSSDAYKKLLMNLQEFISVHAYLAERLSLEPGRYIHIIDSCHIHVEDEAAARALLSDIRAAK